MGCWQRAVVHCIPREIFHFESDHNSEVWSCAASGIFLMRPSAFQTTAICLNRHTFFFFFLRGKASRVHVCKVLLPSTLKMRGICHDESSEGSVMAVIEGVKSNITPGMLSNGWV